MIDAQAFNVLVKIKAGLRSNGVALHPDGKWLYVSNGGDATVSVIDLASNSAVATIAVGQRPWNMALTPDGRKLYVACGRSGSVAVIDTRRTRRSRTSPSASCRGASPSASRRQGSAADAAMRSGRTVFSGPMYVRFFGLKQQPFSIAPDPRYLS